MPAPRVHVVCQNYRQDRVIPRMAGALEKGLGWRVSAGGPARGMVDVVYFSAYFEPKRLLSWPAEGTAAYFTHREEVPAGNAKQRLFDNVAERVDLRIVTCELYGERLRAIGPTLVAAAPVDQDRFMPMAIELRPDRARPVVGLSGYTYPNGRKGEDLVRAVLRAPIGGRVEWVAIGRGWPVRTARLPWAAVPAFYRGLDVLLCPSRVEGVPMPPLEALASGVRVVIPRGVGLLDELGEVEGVHRYDCGDVGGLIEALEEAAFPDASADVDALRAIVSPYTMAAWVEDHRRGFAEVFGTRGTNQP